MFISYGIATQHGGTLTVSSDGEGMGSVFSLEIPQYEINRNLSSLSGMMSYARSSSQSISRRSSPQPLLTPMSPSTHVIPGFGIIPDSGSSTPVTPFFEINRGDLLRSSHKNSTSMSSLISFKSAKSFKSADSHTLRYHTSSSSSKKHINQTETVAALENHHERVPEAHIFVVDDSPTVRKMLCRLLRCDGRRFFCDEASDGEEAVDRIRQKTAKSVNGSIEDGVVTDAEFYNATPYDVIIIDYEMPNMSGPEASQKIRYLGYKGLIIGATGHSEDHERDVFLGHGADAVMVKPVDIRALVMMIEKHVESTAKEGIEDISSKHYL
mmetsp:Transcript_3403/g.3536  ORF Transcript_3403/g.3536 Transcript_3403/m.3536 type:complete len:325 (+) Transcript_3403:96-1070(+)